MYYCVDYFCFLFLLLLYSVFYKYMFVRFILYLYIYIFKPNIQQLYNISDDYKKIKKWIAGLYQSKLHNSEMSLL